MPKYIYNETLSNTMDSEQKKILKQLKPKLRKPNRVLVTKKYEPNAYTYHNMSKLTTPTLNMYDYFQGATDITPHDLHVRMGGIFNLTTLKVVGISNEKSEIYHDGVHIANVNIAPLTVQLIGEIEWLDAAGNMMSRDFYDRRGFLSSTQYFHINGDLGHQIIYDIAGKPKIILSMMNINGVNSVTGYKLLDYDGADYLFVTEDELWKFFKSELESEGK